MRRIRAALLGALGAAACACSPSTPEGTTREVKATWPSGVVRTVGVEVFHDGAWQKRGEFVFFDEDGDESHRGSYVDGLESGAWTERYEDGVTGRGEYVRGQRHGEWTLLHPNGKLAEKGRYEAGKRVGAWKAWSPAGEPRPERTYPAERGDE